MNGEVFKVTTLVISMTAFAVIRSPAGAVKIGDCSLRHFIFGGQTCQRIMMINLKQNPQRKCSDEYTKLKECLTKHVTDCVKDDALLKGMADQITKLLLLQAYHCGDQPVDTSDISLLLWRVTKCKPERLDEAFECWNDFNSVFHQSRNNASNLCEPYAEAKRDCAEVAMAVCEGLCEYLVKDGYNTFCPSTKQDPSSYSITAECSVLHEKLQCTDSVLYEKAMECEDQGAEEFANGIDHTCSKEKTRNRKCLEETLNNTCSSNTLLLNETEKALQGTLTNKRLFCNSVNLDPNTLDDDVKQLADCKPEFFTEAEDCAKPFRDNFQAPTSEKRISDKTCSDYQTARECINKAREDHCNFQTDVLAITTGIKNPFCPSEAATTSISLMLQLVASIIPFFFFYY